MAVPERGTKVPLDRKWWFLRRRILLVLAMLLLADHPPNVALGPLEWDKGSGFSLDAESRQPSGEELQECFEGAVDPDLSSLTGFGSLRELTPHDDKTEFVLLAVESDLTSDDVLREMTRLHLRAALYEELLASAQRFPRSEGIPEAGEVVALGSIAGKRERPVGSLRLVYIPVLTYRNGRVTLGVKPSIRVVRWPAKTTRFLAARIK